ncbi:hypothetical protein FACS1894151_11010 [Spirochaetia bacterium]|nr:hypothetical protein FACS1894151_11010 [Spirochaetia bacterium]
MKFRDGYWLLQEGIQQIKQAEVWETENSAEKLTVYFSTKKVRDRGDTMGPMLTLELSSPLIDIIHVRAYHHKGAVNPPPYFDLLPDNPGAFSVRRKAFCEESSSDEGAYTVFSAGNLEVHIEPNGNCRFIRNGKKLTEIFGKFSGYYNWGKGAVDGAASYSPGGKAYMVQYLGLSVGEAVYGLGERFTALVKNGQSVDVWNEDGGTATEQAYKNVPFYITTNGYGVLVNNPGRASFEVASEIVGAVQFSVPGESIDYYVIAGNTMADVLSNYTSLSGKPALPPAWSFGLWLTTSFTTSYDEKTVNSFIDGMAQRKIPLSVFHFDCFWMKAYQWVDFEWDSEQFPDPAGMLKRLKDRGLKICVWINPYIGQKSAMFDEGAAKGRTYTAGQGTRRRDRRGRKAPLSALRGRRHAMRLPQRRKCRASAYT